jgi:hypothetical protein
LTKFDWLMLVMSVISILLIPTLALVFRLVVKWTKAEARLEDLADDMRKLVTDKDKTHTEMLTAMREDRASTDKRLRWLEENLWATTFREKGKGKHAL